MVQSEPDKKSKAYAWSTAIGLQLVDGLKPSEYLLETAMLNIEGEITQEEARERLETYYSERSLKYGDRTDEADKVSQRIAAILGEDAFVFSPEAYISIHKYLFEGIYKHAGKVRDYNISKKEWVLNGASVSYGSAYELRAALEYDISREKNFSYKGLSMEETIHHLAVFLSNLWQIHAFGEGNTRTTAVFFIKYLRTLGFNIDNNLFEHNSWYFRNALVRANYNDLKNNIHETTEYLELFLRNLLLGEANVLQNRTLHVSGLAGPSSGQAGDSGADVREEPSEYQAEPVQTAGNRVLEIRRRTGMSRKDFSDRTGIPVRTLEDWESGRRNPPAYVPRLLEYQIRYEELLRK